MISALRTLLASPRGGATPEGPSTLACHACGQHALGEDTPHEFAAGLTDRLICTVCGAHYFVGT